MKNGLERIRLVSLRDKIMSAQQAIELIQDGAVVVLVVQVKPKLCLWLWLNMQKNIL